MNSMKDFINALKKGKGYDWICQHGQDLNKYELIDIIKELLYSIRSCESDSGANYIYDVAVEQLCYLYQEED